MYTSSWRKRSFRGNGRGGNFKRRPYGNSYGYHSNKYDYNYGNRGVNHYKRIYGRWKNYDEADSGLFTVNENLVGEHEHRKHLPFNYKPQPPRVYNVDLSTLSITEILDTYNDDLEQITYQDPNIKDTIQNVDIYKDDNGTVVKDNLQLLPMSEQFSNTAVTTVISNIVENGAETGIICYRLDSQNQLASAVVNKPYTEQLNICKVSEQFYLTLSEVLSILPTSTYNSRNQKRDFNCFFTKFIYLVSTDLLLYPKTDDDQYFKNDSPATVMGNIKDRQITVQSFGFGTISTKFQSILSLHNSTEVTQFGTPSGIDNAKFYFFAYYDSTNSTQRLLNFEWFVGNLQAPENQKTDYFKAYCSNILQIINKSSESDASRIGIALIPSYVFYPEGTKFETFAIAILQEDKDNLIKFPQDIQVYDDILNDRLDNFKVYTECEIQNNPIHKDLEIIIPDDLEDRFNCNVSPHVPNTYENLAQINIIMYNALHLMCNKSHLPTPLPCEYLIALANTFNVQGANLNAAGAKQELFFLNDTVQQRIESKRLKKMLSSKSSPEYPLKNQMIDFVYACSMQMITWLQDQTTIPSHFGLGYKKNNFIAFFDTYFLEFDTMTTQDLIKYRDIFDYTSQTNETILVEKLKLLPTMDPPRTVLAAKDNCYKSTLSLEEIQQEPYDQLITDFQQQYDTDFITDHPEISTYWQCPDFPYEFNKDAIKLLPMGDKIAKLRDSLGIQAATLNVSMIAAATWTQVARTGGITQVDLEKKFIDPTFTAYFAYETGVCDSPANLWNTYILAKKNGVIFTARPVIQAFDSMVTSDQMRLYGLHFNDDLQMLFIAYSVNGAILVKQADNGDTPDYLRCDGKIPNITPIQDPQNILDMEADTQICVDNPDFNMDLADILEMNRSIAENITEFRGNIIDLLGGFGGLFSWIIPDATNSFGIETYDHYVKYAFEYLYDNDPIPGIASNDSLADITDNFIQWLEDRTAALELDPTAPYVPFFYDNILDPDVPPIPENDSFDGIKVFEGSINSIPFTSLDVNHCTASNITRRLGICETCPETDVPEAIRNEHLNRMGCAWMDHRFVILLKWHAVGDDWRINHYTHFNDLPNPKYWQCGNGVPPSYAATLRELTDAESTITFAAGQASAPEQYTNKCTVHTQQQTIDLHEDLVEEVNKLLYATNAADSTLRASCSLPLHMQAFEIALYGQTYTISKAMQPGNDSSVIFQYEFQYAPATLGALISKCLGDSQVRAFLENTVSPVELGMYLDPQLGTTTKGVIVMDNGGTQITPSQFVQESYLPANRNIETKLLCSNDPDTTLIRPICPDNPLETWEQLQIINRAFLFGNGIEEQYYRDTYYLPQLAYIAQKCYSWMKSNDSNLFNYSTYNETNAWLQTNIAAIEAEIGINFGTTIPLIVHQFASSPFDATTTVTDVKNSIGPISGDTDPKFVGIFCSNDASMVIKVTLAYDETAFGGLLSDTNFVPTTFPPADAQWTCSPPPSEPLFTYGGLCDPVNNPGGCCPMPPGKIDNAYMLTKGYEWPQSASSPISVGFLKATFEERYVAWGNQIRADAGLPPLYWSDFLGAACLLSCALEQREGYASHVYTGATADSVANPGNTYSVEGVQDRVQYWENEHAVEFLDLVGEGYGAAGGNADGSDPTLGWPETWDTDPNLLFCQFKIQDVDAYGWTADNYPVQNPTHLDPFYNFNNVAIGGGYPADINRIGLAFYNGGVTGWSRVYVAYARSANSDPADDPTFTADLSTYDVLVNNLTTANF